MISVQEATRIIQAHTIVAPVEEIALTRANGRVLREDIRADRDFPPFHRVTMDGIAFQFRENFPADSYLLVAGVQHAGERPKRLKAKWDCLEVMTGTVLPKGADTVVRYEDVEFRFSDGQNFVRFNVPAEHAWQNVHQQGSDRKAGDLLLLMGRRLSSADVGVAASVGKPVLKVSKALSIAVISTGDELVDINQKPLPYQIRRSNVYALSATFEQVGARTEQFHFRDDPKLLRLELTKLLQQFDCLVLSGGVSMGKADFIPDVLANLGVEKLFHTVAQRPGKPLWFGRSSEGKMVFALPGNPVSTFMCAYRYVLPWLRACSQQMPTPPRKAILAETVTFKPALTYLIQVQTYQDAEGRLMARPYPGSGSGDLVGLVDADAFLELPAEKPVFEKGEIFPVWEFGS